MNVTGVQTCALPIWLRRVDARARHNGPSKLNAVLHRFDRVPAEAQGGRIMRHLFGALWRRRRPDVVALICIALFFVAFFPQGLFGGKYLLANDAFFYSYPLRTVVWRMLRAGELPLWTPYIQSGYPLISMAQIGFAYPLTWGYLFLPGRVAEQI